ncbi:MAG: hypothetical protein NC204_06655 [Candidatus Amulumruptor caecigallinarius]|nr:hypothetical protein [Candidatus Amulumruptor caecigallinarius]
MEYLTLRHDCVVLPGVGAFISTRRSAHRDSVTGCWHPMTRELSFNGSLTHDDGLLANSYARKQKLSYQDGRAVLLRAIDKLRHQLEADGEVSLGKLGMLSMRDGTICYTPLISGERMAETMGYGVLPAPQSLHSQNATNTTAIRSNSATNTDTTDDSENNRAKRVVDTTRNYYIAVNKKFARVAACLLAVATVAALTFILPDIGHLPHDKASVVPVENIESIMDAASPVETTHKSDMASAEQMATDAAESDATIVAETEAPARYQLIVATFRTRAEAEKYIMQTESSSYRLKPVESATLCRVSAQGSDDKAVLLATMSEPGFRKEFSEAWIWSADKK